jgi:peptidoglycan/LPS O-acetylase OafA/YrhL
MTALTFAVFLLAMQHEDSAGGQACRDGGLRASKPGHRWTAWTTRLMALAVLLACAWVAWRLLEPPIPS